MSFDGRDDDPTDFEGLGPFPDVLPVIPDDAPRKDPRTNAATGASAAGVRAFTAQAIAFYFRAPVKAFFRTRVDYLAYARNAQQQYQATHGSLVSKRLAWLSSTTPGVLAYAVREYGWKVIPEQILPPLLANVTVGAVLYTTYLQILARLHEESAKATTRVYPPPTVGQTFAAGWLAGSIQSFIAAPLDAIQVRYERRSDTANPLDKNSHQQRHSMWRYSREKLKEIGVRGIFAGWGLSFLKDSFGSGIFFSTFEYVKAQGYYNFVRWYYSSLNEEVVDRLMRKRPAKAKTSSTADNKSSRPTTIYHGKNEYSRQLETDPLRTVIKPHYAIEPAFLMLAGLGASVAQQTVLYPLSHLQTQHWEHLEALDKRAQQLRHKPRKWRMFTAYYNAYQETWHECQSEARALHQGSMRKWLYRGFWWNTVRQVPSTSAGLIIFELVRRKYGMDREGEVRINRDGYDILVH